MGRIRVDTLDRTSTAFDFDPAGFTSVGSNMIVFPEPTPRLDILQVANADSDTIVNINEGTTDTVFLNLPFGASPSSTVTVQARDFSRNVPIAVVLQPDNGPRVIVEDSIDNSVSNPVTKVIAIELPVNVRTQIFVWTRTVAL